MRNICLDTVLFNRLYEQAALATNLAKQLEAKQARLTLNVQVVFELAKTFSSKRLGYQQKAKGLFSFLKEFRQHIAFLDHPNMILIHEALTASSERSEVQLFHNEFNTAQFWNKISALADGAFTGADAASIAIIEDGSHSMRAGGTAFKSNAPSQDRRLAKLPFAEYLAATLSTCSGSILMQKLCDAFPRATSGQLEPIANKLLGSESYRTAHAMVRADVYARWRALRGTVPSDLYGDCLNVVHAAYCDVYATADGDQQKWVPLVLTKTPFALYASSLGSADAWVVSIL